MDYSKLFIPPQNWTQQNLAYFLKPNSYTVVNSRQFPSVGHVISATFGIDKLAGIVESYVQSAHQRNKKNHVRSTELSDLIVDLDILFLLLDQVYDLILTYQQPNHNLRSSVLYLFVTATIVFDDKDKDLNSCCYYSVEIKYLIFFDGCVVNLCNDVH